MIEELQQMKADLDKTTNQLAENIRALINAVRLGDAKLGLRIDTLDTQLTTEIERLEARTGDRRSELHSHITTGMVANDSKLRHHIDNLEVAKDEQRATTKAALDNRLLGILDRVAKLEATR